MTEITKNDTSGGYRAVSIALFLCLFAGQAAMIAMSPVLADAASDLHVSTAAAGQLRTITGLAAGITALVFGVLAGRVGLGRQLLAASALLAIASIASAAAPTFPLLALAQLPVGVAVAVLTTAGTLAAAEWVAPELRTRTLSWALVGQPAAWIVGMPLIEPSASAAGATAGWHYRLPPPWRPRFSSPRGRGSRPPNRSLPAFAPPSVTARSRAGWHPSCSRTPPGRERSSTPARSSPSRTEPPPS
jgi:predicted MFS family arabinose efflux permease